MVLQHTDWFPTRQPVRAVVSLNNPILSKDGRVCRYVVGRTVMGHVQGYTSKRGPVGVLVGTTEADHVFIPYKNIAGIQASNKVLKDRDDMLVVE